MEASRLQEPNVGRVFTAPLGDVHLWSHVSCCCCYLDLRAVQRVRDSAPSPIHSEKRDHRLQATSPERHYCGIFVGAARQTRNGRCRSRPGPRSSDSIGWFCYPAAVWRHAQTTAEVRPLSVWPGRYVGRPSHRHEGWGIPFISCVEAQERSQDFASWKFSASTVAGLQISWAVVKRWRAREGRVQESPERQGRGKRWSSMPWKRVISSWPAGQRRIHKAANQMGRLYHWLQSWNKVGRLWELQRCNP